MSLIVTLEGTPKWWSSLTDKLVRLAMCLSQTVRIIIMNMIMLVIRVISIIRVIWVIRVIWDIVYREGWVVGVRTCVCVCVQRMNI